MSFPIFANHKDSTLIKENNKGCSQCLLHILGRDKYYIKGMIYKIRET